jgi:hypothetical protein
VSTSVRGTSRLAGVGALRMLGVASLCALVGCWGAVPVVSIRLPADYCGTAFVIFGDPEGQQLPVTWKDGAEPLAIPANGVLTLRGAAPRRAQFRFSMDTAGGSVIPVPYGHEEGTHVRPVTAEASTRGAGSPGVSHWAFEVDGPACTDRQARASVSAGVSEVEAVRERIRRSLKGTPEAE